MATITENKGRTFVTVRIEAWYQDELDPAIRKYLNDYPEAGYATQVRAKGQNEDGSFFAKIVRSASCD